MPHSFVSFHTFGSWTKKGDIRQVGEKEGQCDRAVKVAFWYTAREMRKEKRF